MIRIDCLWVPKVFLICATFSGHAVADTGEQLYERCAACHLPAAQGVLGAFPPLTQRLGSVAATQAGRDYLAMVVQAGLMGGIEVDGVAYQGFMPAQGPGLGDDGVAAVLNYLLESFNKETLSGNWRAFSREEIAAIRSRYPNATGQTTQALRRSAFPNRTIDAGSERAQYHWVMNCQGCHGVDAQGTDVGAPRMAGMVARFLHTAEGRAFLARVPGVAFVSLSDREVAHLLNWVVRRFDEEHLPQGFEPYTEDEVRTLRRQPLISQASHARRKILESIRDPRSAQ